MSFTTFSRAVGLITAMLAGYLTAHVIVLARYFDWIIESGNASMLEATYSVFRVEVDPVTPYLASFIVQLILAMVLFAVVIVRRSRFGAKQVAATGFAVFALPLTMLVFTTTGFHEVEHNVMSASDLSEETLSIWLSLNVPLHMIAAAIYLVAATMLLFTDLPAAKQQSETA